LVDNIAKKFKKCLLPILRSPNKIKPGENTEHQSQETDQ